MKKIRKGKKKLIILLLIIVAIIATVVIINIVKKPKSPEEPEYQDPIISLPETTYSNMEVKNIQMEYLKENNETEIRMEIHNTTSEKVEKEIFTVVWIGPNDEILAELGHTKIEDLDVDEVCSVSNILPGDLTTTKAVKLIKE